MARTGSEAPFVGRAHELSSMRARLDLAGGGEPGTVVVDGPAGIGETSLVRRFLGGVSAEWRVARAGGDEIETQLP